ncbi:M48 family metallopeptidase [Parasphingorhabdus cellanae]|uniref:M48 family metalloprotease n=1 Tax=Parasphingorhabdus cellanae TaxID=2806553 RepID=A0ABX7T2G9_9SPHN|nr:M48 family metallopeptidase [Parasphingorhabdus cellanae]QTD54997.1 M48 family metalloprotease [Parasphingorhabdus cellanae]
MLRILSFALVISFAAHAPAKAAQELGIESQDVLALKSLQLLDQRLHATGYRLVAANAAFCTETVPNTGILLHDINQYGDQQTARFALGFSTPIAINAVASDSPAAIAELEAGDGVTAIDGMPLEDIPIDAEKLADQKSEYRRIAAIKARLVSAGTDGRTELMIERGGIRQAVNLAPARTCPSAFQIRVSKKREASADGKLVSISSTLAEYVLSDDELAAIAAHELAHNLLKHRDRLNAQKVNRGFFGQFGKSAGRIKAAEIEADRLSVWLMANAGYDPQAAIRFWTRYGKQYGKGIFSASTHYRWKKRVKLFEEEIAKMQQIEAVDGKYAPPLLVASKPE